MNTTSHNYFLRHGAGGIFISFIYTYLGWFGLGLRRKNMEVERQRVETQSVARQLSETSVAI